MFDSIVSDFFDSDVLDFEGVGQLTMLGTTLRRVREQRGWSIRELAERSGVDKSAISRLEAGVTRTVQSDNIEALARTLNFPAATLRKLGQMPSGGVTAKIDYRITTLSAMENLPPEIPSSATLPKSEPNGFGAERRMAAEGDMESELCAILAKLEGRQLPPSESASSRVYEQLARRLITLLSQSREHDQRTAMWTQVRRLIDTAVRD